MVKSNRGISIIESMVCMVVIGIGFIAIMQLSAFSIHSMDRATEQNKLNKYGKTKFDEGQIQIHVGKIIIV